MAEKEMWDYLSEVAADYTATELSISPDSTIIESGAKNQVVHTGDDGSEEIVTRSSTSRFYMTCVWNNRTASVAGTIFDMHHDTDKANGIANSIYLDHGTDGHTYTVRFAEPLNRTITMPEFHSMSVKFRVLGRKPA